MASPKNLSKMKDMLSSLMAMMDEECCEDENTQEEAAELGDKPLQSGDTTDPSCETGMCEEDEESKGKNKKLKMSAIASKLKMKMGK